MQVSAVAITNKKDILTHIGAGSDHHVARKEIITDLSKEVIQSGKLKVAHTREGIDVTILIALLKEPLSSSLYT